MPAIKHAKTIGVIVHRLDSHFITTALNGIETTAALYGYETIITHSQESSAIEASNARLLLDRSVDGVIASLSADTDCLSHFDAFAKAGTPVIFFDSVSSTDSSHAVVIDNHLCGFQATEHLIRQGCSRIAIVTSSLDRNVYSRRYAGFRAALSRYGLPFTADQLILGDILPESGFSAAQQILRMDPLPDGLFITSDLVAAACIHTLLEAGVRIPDDIAVVGFNNDPVGRLITPRLTTIDYNGFELGRQAALRLLAHGSGSHSEATSAVIPSRLIVRDSSLRRLAS